jgi:hypothetical protein
MRRLFYLLREAWANMRANRTTTVVAILTTAFTLSCVGIFLLLYVNLRSAAGWLQEAHPGSRGRTGRSTEGGSDGGGHGVYFKGTGVG